MDLIEAVVLGVVQGLAEFIPVSSSGHLIVIPRLFGWDDMGLSFDVALHVGTLLALFAYFRRDLASMLVGFTRHVVKRMPYGKGGADAEGRLFVPIIVASVPAAVVGLLFDDAIETRLREWYWVAGALVVVGLVMLLAERVGRKRRGADEMGYADYITMGCAQAIALFPGVSRSGITICSGLFRNLDRAAAARFSFLLSSPAILGAAVLEFRKQILKNGLPAADVLPFAVGVVTSATVGYLAIGFLMNYLKNRSLNVFAYYRFAFAALMAVVFFVK